MMFIEPWMALLVVAAFGACAHYSYKNGKLAGVIAGIDGTFEYLEKHKVIKFNADGTITGLKNKAVLIKK
jgi:hypothetical protein